MYGVVVAVRGVANNLVHQQQNHDSIALPWFLLCFATKCAMRRLATTYDAPTCNYIRCADLQLYTMRRLATTYDAPTCNDVSRILPYRACFLVPQNDQYIILQLFTHAAFVLVLK